MRREAVKGPLATAFWMQAMRERLCAAAFVSSAWEAGASKRPGALGSHCELDMNQASRVYAK